MTIKTRLIAGGLIAGLMASTAYASVIDRPFFKVLGTVVVWGGNGTGAGATAPVVSDFALLTPASGQEAADLISDDVTTVITGDLIPIAGNGIVDGDQIAAGLTAGEGVITDANSDGVLDAGDSLTAFAIDSTTDIDAGLIGNNHESSFYVASNAPFDIRAKADQLVNSDDFAALSYENISYELSLNTGSGTDGSAGNTIAWGSASRDPGDVVAAFGAGQNADLSALAPGAAGADANGYVQVFDGDDRTADTVGSLAAQSVRFDAVYQFDGIAGNGTVDAYDMSMGVGELSARVTYTVFVP